MLSGLQLLHSAVLLAKTATDDTVVPWKGDWFQDPLSGQIRSSALLKRRRSAYGLCCLSLQALGHLDSSSPLGQCKSYTIVLTLCCGGNDVQGEACGGSGQTQPFPQLLWIAVDGVGGRGSQIPRADCGPKAESPWVSGQLCVWALTFGCHLLFKRHEEFFF